MGNPTQVLAISAVALILLFPSIEGNADEASETGAVERELAAEVAKETGAGVLVEDIEAVERELATESMTLAVEADALAVYERAQKRAQEAVRAYANELEGKSEEAWVKYTDVLRRAREARDREREAWDKARQADHDALLKDTGKPGITFEERMKAYDEWLATDQTRPMAEALSEKADLLTKDAQALKRQHTVISNKFRLMELKEKVDDLVRKMTIRFLGEEIVKVNTARQKLDQLERKLREILRNIQQDQTF